MHDLVDDPGELSDVYTSAGEHRAAWQEQLRAIAEVAANGAGTEAVGEETQRILNALGYGGNR